MPRAVTTSSGIERRHLEALVAAKIGADRWLAGDERLALKRAFFRAGDNIADNVLVPAVANFHQQVVFGGAIPVNIAERRVNSCGADPGRLGQHGHDVVLLRCEAGKRRLLAQQLFHFGRIIRHGGTADGVRLGCAAVQNPSGTAAEW